jgi:hypothetical protein
MAGPWSLDRLAALTGEPEGRLRRYPDAGLLHRQPDGDFEPDSPAQPMCCAGSASRCLAAQPDTTAEFSCRSAMRSCSCSPTPQTPSNSGSRWTVSSTTSPNFPHRTSAHIAAASSTARATTSAPQSISPRAWRRPARQARFLITEDLRDAAGDLSDAEFASLPPRRLKGIPDPICLLEVRGRRPEPTNRETDPVCGMRLHPDDVTSRATWRGMTFALL